MTDSRGLDAATLRAIAVDRGLDLSESQIADVVAFNDALRSDLDRVRAVPLPFTGEVTTPLDALRWIDNGGRRRALDTGSDETVGGNADEAPAGARHDQVIGDVAPSTDQQPAQEAGGRP